MILTGEIEVLKILFSPSLALSLDHLWYSTQYLCIKKRPKIHSAREPIMQLWADFTHKQSYTTTDFWGYTDTLCYGAY